MESADDSELHVDPVQQEAGTTVSEEAQIEAEVVSQERAENNLRQDGGSEERVAAQLCLAAEKDKERIQTQTKESVCGAVLHSGSEEHLPGGELSHLRLAQRVRRGVGGDLLLTERADRIMHSTIQTRLRRVRQEKGIESLQDQLSEIENPKNY